MADEQPLRGDHSQWHVSVGIEILTEQDELDGGWVAWIEGIPGCMSQGDSEEEAIEHLGEALGLAMAERALDAPVDTPKADREILALVKRLMDEDKEILDRLSGA